jgi:hypothetical protein
MSFDAAEDPAVLDPAKEGDGLQFARVEVPTSQEGSCPGWWPSAGDGDGDRTRKPVAELLGRTWFSFCGLVGL